MFRCISTCAFFLGMSFPVIPSHTSITSVLTPEFFQNEKKELDYPTGTWLYIQAVRKYSFRPQELDGRHKQNMRGWRNWQTRTFEVRVVYPWGFESPPSHHRKPAKLR